MENFKCDSFINHNEQHRYLVSQVIQGDRPITLGRVTIELATHGNSDVLIIELIDEHGPKYNQIALSIDQKTTIHMSESHIKPKTLELEAIISFPCYTISSKG